MNAEIQVRHHSLTFKRRKRTLDTVKITDEQRTTIQMIAIGVFVDMCNGGYSLQESLAAIYLTGLQNGSATAKDDGR